MNLCDVKSHLAADVDVNKVMLKKVLGYDNAIEIQRISFNWSEVLESRSRSLSYMKLSEQSIEISISAQKVASLLTGPFLKSLACWQWIQKEAIESVRARLGRLLLKSSDTFF